MAKAILTIEDTDHGTVTVSVDFVPEMKTDVEMTQAQSLATDLLQDISEGESFLSRLATTEGHRSSVALPPFLHG